MGDTQSKKRPTLYWTDTAHKDDFGPTPVGRLIKNLDTKIREKHSQENIHAFLQDHKELISASWDRTPILPLVLLRIYAVTDETYSEKQNLSEMRKNLAEFCLNNDHVWDNLANGDDKFQRMSKQRWMQYTLRVLKNELDVHKRLGFIEGLMIKGEDDRSVQLLVDKDYYTPHAIKSTTALLKKATQKYPDNPHIMGRYATLVSDAERLQISRDFYDRVESRTDLAIFSNIIEKGAIKPSKQSRKVKYT